MPVSLRESQTPAANATRMVRVTVLPGVPPHPLVAEFHLQQAEEELAFHGRQGTSPRARTAPTLSSEEVRSVVRAAEERGLPPMASPVVMVTPGQDAQITIGEIQAVPGEGRETPVTVKDGVMIRVGVLADGPEIPANASALRVEFRERKDGQDITYASTGAMIVPHGRWEMVLATGESESLVRMLLVSVEPAPDEAGVNPVDPGSYPYATAMIWMMELRGPVAFDSLLAGIKKGERSGTAEFAGDRAVTGVVVNDGARAGKGAWVCVVPAGRLAEFGDALRGAGAKHVASPVLIGKPATALTLAPGSLDKAHSSTGPYGVTVSVSMARGGASVLEGVQWVMSPADSSTRRTSTFERVRLEEGEALAVMQPPTAAGGPWSVTVYTPSIVAQHEDYPFQTASPLGGGPQGQVKKQQTVAPKP